MKPEFAREIENALMAHMGGSSPVGHMICKYGRSALKICWNMAKARLMAVNPAVSAAMQTAEDFIAISREAVQEAASSDAWKEIWAARPVYVPFGTYVFIKDGRPNKCLSREHIEIQLKGLSARLDENCIAQHGTSPYGSSLEELKKPDKI
jgi:hypothetical protein